MHPYSIDTQFECVMYVSTNTLETIFSILFINKNSIIVIVYFY